MAAAAVRRAAVARAVSTHTARGAPKRAGAAGASAAAAAKRGVAHPAAAGLVAPAPKRGAALVCCADAAGAGAESSDAADALAWTKAADLRALSNEEIMSEVGQAKKALLELRILRAQRKEYKRHHFKLLRTKVAQLKTIMRERELAEGVGKRESRVADYQRSKETLYW